MHDTLIVLKIKIDIIKGPQVTN